MRPQVRKWLAEIGRRGGRRSRRVLTPEAARAMVTVREARRAYRRFHTECFWSFDPDYQVTREDVAWVAQQLRRQGGREAWLLGTKLCR
ncbi:MAG: hypothetical protein ACE5IK_03550 [Acidobacteriota bacterium]